MARLSSSYHYACLYMLLLGFSLQLCSQLSVSEPVEFLPGFPGPLPFELETGYVGVDEGEDVQLFYYFVKSERNPKEDPLFLWLTGGPGCSVLSAFFYELGPLMFKEVEYNGSVPELVVNPNSWTKVASILFVDLPVGTGFSYGRTTKASYSIDIQSSHQIDEFLRKAWADYG
ncbi:Peptidase S10, serine carboxypeptidase [Dillenia turbinata]|uniref:Peptidase S10, serine carboxypeptidase n=1 Tax=Dillenia turbinata TaxID=194707 RepID=A0AAN8VQW2_9MAGN